MLVNVETYAGLGLVTGLVYVAGARHLGLYQLHDLLHDGRDNWRVLESWCFAVLLLTVLLFVLKIGSSVSRVSVICFVITGAICLPWWRRRAKRNLRKALRAGRVRGCRAILLGHKNELTRFSKRRLLSQFGLEEIERISLPACGTSRDLPTLSAVNTAIQCARDNSAEEMVLALPWTDAEQLEVVCKQLRSSPVRVRLIPDSSVFAIFAHDRRGPARSLLIEIQRTPLSATERAVKRLLDLIVAGTCIVLFAPLLVLCAAGIKINSRGPIIFRQRRRGFNGKEFAIYKFRTMKVLEDGPSIIQAKKVDPRVTRVGRVLRRTSIDELPQLFNVIKGQMSVVGPRPHAVAHDNEYGRAIGNYAFRHHVKPGMTGWAQVHGYRGETKNIEQMAERINLDLWYINNWSIFLDITILARTPFVLVGRSTY